MTIRFRSRWVAAAAAASIGWLVPQPARSQVLNGSLVGNVTDATSASIPGAKVKITHVETNQVRETTTNPDGTYTFPTIPPGTYEMAISREGFQTFTQRNIPVTINTTVRVDATLQVGASTQSVEVTGQAAVLQTDRADVRGEVTSQTLGNLPVPTNRNFQNLFVTLPGFTPPANAFPGRPIPRARSCSTPTEPATPRSTRKSMAPRSPTSGCRTSRPTFRRWNRSIP